MDIDETLSIEGKHRPSHEINYYLKKLSLENGRSEDISDIPKGITINIGSAPR